MLRRASSIRSRQRLGGRLGITGFLRALRSVECYATKRLSAMIPANQMEGVSRISAFAVSDKRRFA